MCNHTLHFTRCLLNFSSYVAIFYVSSLCFVKSASCTIKTYMLQHQNVHAAAVSSLVLDVLVLNEGLYVYSTWEWDAWNSEMSEYLRWFCWLSRHSLKQRVNKMNRLRYHFFPLTTIRYFWVNSSHIFVILVNEVSLQNIYRFPVFAAPPFSRSNWGNEPMIASYLTKLLACYLTKKIPFPLPNM